jgi:hypothetical protein
MSLSREEKIAKTKMDQWDEYFEKFPHPTEGKRVCTKCKKSKYFNTEEKELSEFHIRHNDAYKMKQLGYKNADYLVPDSWCKVCKNKRIRERRLERLKENPEKERQRRKEQDRQYRERIGDEEYKRRSRESGRRKRRMRGVPERGPRIKDTYPSRFVRVPVGPFRQWALERWPNAEGSYKAMREISYGAESQMSRIIHGKIDTVGLDWVDEILTFCNGPHVSTLYPEEYGS